MEHYVGLDVSLKLTSICIVDRTGKVEREGVVTSDPDAIATFIKLHASHVVRIGLETGATSTWLWTELNKIGLPVICIDARHAKAVLKMQINKSDRNDAAGIARIMQCGWYKEVCVKDLDSHATKALLVSRALLVKIKRDIENQIRGLLKNLGLVIGRAKMNVFAVRAAQLAEERSELFAAVDPLLKAREAVEQQIEDLDPQGAAAGSQQCSRATVHDGSWASARSRPFASLRRSMTPLASRGHEASEPTQG
jgi:transposase